MSVRRCRLTQLTVLLEFSGLDFVMYLGSYTTLTPTIIFGICRLAAQARHQVFSQSTPSFSEMRVA